MHDQRFQPLESKGLNNSMTKTKNLKWKFSDISRIAVMEVRLDSQVIFKKGGFNISWGNYSRQ